MGAVSILETKALLRAFLLADASVREAVDGRVLSSHVSDADAPTLLTDTPIVVFDVAGGDLRWFGVVEVVRFEVYTYAKAGADEAARVYDLVAARLQHERVIVDGLDLVGVSREADRPVSGFNEAVGGWFARGRWTLSVS